MAMGTLGIEVLLVKLLYDHAIPLAAAGVLHLAVVAVLGWWTSRLKKAQRDLRLPLLLVAATGFVGPIGTSGTLVALGLWILYSRSSTPFEEWYESLFPEEKSKLSIDLFEQLSSDQGDLVARSAVAPFLDVLSFGTQEQKQAAVALITDHFQPPFAPALRRALHDSNAAIRVQAAASITRVENRFLTRVLELSQAVRDRPDDPDALWALARHYDDYAFTGILESKREEENRKKALELYHEYLRLRSADLYARWMAGRILLRKGEFAEAAHWLEQSIQQGFSSPQILLGYLESLFRLGRFGEVRELARAHGADLAAYGQFSSPAVEAVELWAGKIPGNASAVVPATS